MKTIIAGSRGVHKMQWVEEAIVKSGFIITEVVSGTAKGADRWGERWAMQNQIICTQFPADWNGPFGLGAGFARNVEMADYADALVLIWDGRSKGSLHMLTTAKQKGLKVYVHLYKQDSVN